MMNFGALLRKYGLLFLAFGAIIFTSLHHAHRITPNDRLIRYIAIGMLLGYLFRWAAKRKSVIGFNGALLLSLLLILELYCFFQLGRPGASAKNFNPPDLPANHISRLIGSALEPDSVYQEIKVSNQDTMFHVQYSIDQWRKRITPKYDSTKKEFAVFFGCSIAFGFGVNDNETFPYYVQSQSQRYNSYNFATSSQGTNHVLAKLENLPLKEQVRESDGIGVYVFFWDHIYRSIGSMARHTDWLHLAPNYEMENGKVFRNTSFKEGRPIRSWLYEHLYQDNIIKHFKLDFPIKLNKRHYEFMAEMIAEAKRNYVQKFGNEKFIVMVYPNYNDFKPEEMRAFKDELTKRSIQFMDLSGTIEYSGVYSLPGDAHPSSSTHALIAKKFLNQLDSLDWH